jgi:hypothetical protein
MLHDKTALLEAYAASSARVMRQVFQQHRGLQAYKGRVDLAPVVLEKMLGIAAPGDPVIFGAHLYALELTGARREIAKGVTFLLKGLGRKDPHLVGQFAGFAGAALLKPVERNAAGAAPKVLRPQDLDEILKAVEREGGPR